MLSLIGTGSAHNKKGTVIASDVVIVAVYDRLGVPTAVLSRAAREMKYIFREAGMEFIWLDCAPTHGGDTVKGCAGSADSEPLALTVLPDSMAKRLPRTADMFGFATFEDGRSNYAYVFYDRVSSLAANLQLDPGYILGAVASHEIGHLLLGARPHARTGLMSVRWGEQELKNLGFGNLLFNSEEVLLMRTRLHASKTAPSF